MRAVKEDSVLINEGTKYDRLAIAFDASYCWDWHDDLHNIFCCDMPAHLLKDCYETTAKNLPQNSLLLRDIDNHDTVTDWPQRVEIAATNDGMEQIEVINYLIDGIPMVYCGNELACTARLSMFANRFHRGDFEFTDRSNKNSAATKRRTELFKKLNKLKAESDLLRYGKTVWFDTEHKDSIIAFKRVYNNQEFVFIGNTKDCEVSVTLPKNAPQFILLENNSALVENEIKFGPYGYIAYTEECRKNN